MTATTEEVKLTPTQKKLYALLKENTGTHMLDSGGAYGRHWQRNATRDFKTEPAVTLSFEHDDISVTFNLFHWLDEKLVYDSKLDRALQNFARTHAFENKCWMEIIEQFAAKKGYTGLHGDGEPMLVYTYNHENLLDQDIQFVYAEDAEREPLLLLQVHGGCDARGGMSSAKAFRFNGNGEGSDIFDFARASIAAQPPQDDWKQLDLPGLEDAHEPPRWDTENGCRWHFQGNYAKHENSLEDYDIVRDDASQKGQGVIYVDDAGIGYCPITGWPLAAWWY